MAGWGREGGGDLAGIRLGIHVLNSWIFLVGMAFLQLVSLVREPELSKMFCEFQHGEILPYRNYSSRAKSTVRIDTKQHKYTAPSRAGCRDCVYTPPCQSDLYRSGPGRGWRRWGRLLWLHIVWARRSTKGFQKIGSKRRNVWFLIAF